MSTTVPATAMPMCPSAQRSRPTAVASTGSAARPVSSARSRMTAWMP